MSKAGLLMQTRRFIAFGIVNCPLFAEADS